MLVTISVDRPSVGASKAAERSLYVADSELIDPRPRVRLARAFRVRKHPPRGLAVDMAAARLRGEENAPATLQTSRGLARDQ